MIKAYKYIRHYVNDDIHDARYGETEEIFIPDYAMAVCIINKQLYVTSVDSPRTGSPIKLTFMPGLTDEEIELMKDAIPMKFRDFAPSPLTEIKITQKDAANLRTLSRLQEDADMLRVIMKPQISKYL